MYVVDSGQKLHFDLVFAGAKRAGLIDPSAVRLDHVGFGVVKGASSPSTSSSLLDERSCCYSLPPPSSVHTAR